MPVLHLLPRYVSQETVDALQGLIEAAIAGECIGLAVAVLGPGRSYIVDLIGEARRHPALMRGAVAALDDQLAEHVHSTASAPHTQH